MNIWNNRNWKPMLLKEQKKPFNDNNYIFELKFDGIRAIIFVNKNQLSIQSRYGKDITYLYPELQQIKNVIKSDTILDGEIICLKDGFPSFQNIQNRSHLKNLTKIKIQSKKNPVIFMCFDILYQKENLTQIPLMKRKERLATIAENEVLVKVKYIEEKGIPFFKEIKKNQLEGIVAKKKDSIYEIDKRVSNWIKIKNWNIETFYIGGYQINKNNSISILLAEKKNTDFFYVGKVVLYQNNPLYEKIKKQSINKKGTINNCDEKAIFVTPKYTCQVEFLERTNEGILRQPTIFYEN